jgi:electron transfer flavoprotein beta subunit
MAVDLVFCGKQTIDGDTAQVGPGIAKRLGMELLTYVSKVETVDADQRELVVQRRAEGGVQVLKTRLPALITVLEGTNEMRFATQAGIFRAARHPLKVWDKTAAGIEDPAKIGLKGSPTVVSKVFVPQPRASKAELVTCESNAPGDLAVTLIAKLFTQHPSLEHAVAR